MTIDFLIDKVDEFDLQPQKEKVKLIAYFYCAVNSLDTFTTAEIANCFAVNNLNAPSNIHREIANLTSTKPPILLKKVGGYAFQRNSKKQLDELFMSNKHSAEISSTLRSIIPKTGSAEQIIFLEEAIACFEIKSYRAAIIMTWLLAMDTLLEYTLKHKLSEFNDELKKKNKKKFITAKTDFEEYKESEIVEVLKAASIITKEQKKLLDEKLNIRNSAAHPNVVQFREPKVITYIQEMIEEIILKY